VFEVKANVGKNRMLIRLAGTVSADDCRTMLGMLETELQRLKPGVDVLNDVRELAGIPDFPPETVRAAADLLIEKGVRRLVRVVGKQAGVVVSMEKTSRVFGFSAALAYSMDEAEKVLDAPAL
jgi:hypothetical protein